MTKKDRSGAKAEESQPGEPIIIPEDSSKADADPSESSKIDPVVFGPDAELRVGSSFGAIDAKDQPKSFDSLIAADETEIIPEQSTPAPVEQNETAVPAATQPKATAPKGQLKNLLITAGVLVLVVALGFFGLMGYDAYQDHRKAQETAQQEKEQEKAKAEAIKKAENPFAVLVGKVDPPSEDPLDAVVAENQLKIGASTLSIKGATLAPTANGCSLVAITDLCLGARGKLGTGDFDVLLVKDISRTRLLDDPVEFSEFKSSGRTIAAALAIDMGSQEGPDRFGVLTADGTTGFVLIFPKGTTAERVQEVLKASTVI